MGLQRLADVPVGVFFSGGADSSLLASLSKNTDLLFAQYGETQYSNVDRGHAMLISEQLGPKLTTVSINESSTRPNEILQSFYFVADNSGRTDFRLHFLVYISFKSQSARSSGYEVMLSGMGGDEAFAGYPRYLVVKYHGDFEIFITHFEALQRCIYCS